MDGLSILGVALGLAMDAFAVSIAVGLSLPRLSRRHVFRLSFHFGLFQFLMPVAGWSSGRWIQQLLADYDHWAAFVLLAIIGGKMIAGSFRAEEQQVHTDPTRGWALVMLSVATSIDAFAVGLSMAFLRVSIWLPSFIIGVVTAALSVCGMVFASRFGRCFGAWAERCGGLVLIGIGVQIVASHMGWM